MPEPTSVCPAYRFDSPESDRCGWCERYAVNVDRAGRFCARCRSDAAFRADLRRQHAVRLGQACAPTTWCAVFAVATDAGQCRRCKRDPAVRAFLAGQAHARRRRDHARRMAGCAGRGPAIRWETRTCCGGTEQRVAVHRCDRHGEITPDRCAECPDWRAPPDAADGTPTSAGPPGGRGFG